MAHLFKSVKKDKEKDKVEQSPVSPRGDKGKIERKSTIKTDSSEVHAEMPSEAVVEQKFAEVARELKIPTTATMDVQHKWKLVQQYENSQKAGSNANSEDSVDSVLKLLERGRKHIKPKDMIKVRTLLGTMTTSWVKDFLKGNGLEIIVHLFKETVELSPTPQGDAVDIVFECVRSLKAIMNVDFERIVSSVNSIPLLIQYIKPLNPLTKIEIFEFLAVVCFKFPAGYQQIFDALKNIGFKMLLEPFVLKNDDLRIAAMMFINALIYGTDDMEIQGQIIAGLDAAGFRPIFEGVNKNLSGNDNWIEQVKLYQEFQEKFEATDEGQLTKLQLKVNLQEEEIRLLQRKNADLAEKAEDKAFIRHSTLLTVPPPASPSAAPPSPTQSSQLQEQAQMIQQLKQQLDNVQKQLKEKDEHIVKLEERVRAAAAAPPAMPSTGSTNAIPDPSGAPPPPPPPPGAEGGAPPPPPPPPPGAGGAPPPPPPPPPPPGAGGAPPPPPPPPPGAGGAPPPPPPPGAPGAAPAGPVLPEKKKIKPSKKMRGFMWQKIPNPKVIGTYWENAEDEKIKLDSKKLEEIFGIDEMNEQKKKEIAAAMEAAAAQKPVSISILDPKRSNNVEIMLRGLKMNHIEVKKALENMDIDALADDYSVAVQKLLAIKNNIPTPEELKLLDEFDGDKSELGNAEKYYMAIGKIPLLGLRVNSMEYKISFESKFKDVEKVLDSILKGLELVRTKPFLKLLDLVLAIGNYLNGSTNRGQTYGFKMSSLNLMSDVKSPNNPQISLTHFFAEILEKDHADLLTLIRNFTAVHESATQSLSDVSSQVGQLSTGIKPITTQLESAACDNVYKKAMAAWAPNAAKSIEAVVAKNTRAADKFKEVLNFFAEPQTIKSDEFFGILSSWATQIEQAVVTNEKRRAAAEKPAPTLTISAKKPPAGGAPLPAANAMPGEFDSIVKQLKNGSLYRKESIFLQKGGEGGGEKDQKSSAKKKK